MKKWGGRNREGRTSKEKKKKVMTTYLERYNQGKTNNNYNRAMNGGIN